MKNSNINRSSSIIGTNNGGERREFFRPKLRLPILTVIILLGVFLFWYFYPKSNSLPDDLRKSHEILKQSELPPSKLDNQKVIDIETLMSQEKYNEALALVNSLEKTPGLTEHDQAKVNSYKLSACQGLEDVDCVIALNRGDDIYLSIWIAQIYDKQGYSSQASMFYREALNFINKKGGRQYLDELNKNTQQPLNYDEIEKRASDA